MEEPLDFVHSGRFRLLLEHTVPVVPDVLRAMPLQLQSASAGSGENEKAAAAKKAANTRGPDVAVTEAPVRMVRSSLNVHE